MDPLLVFKTTSWSLKSILNLSWKVYDLLYTLSGRIVQKVINNTNHNKENKRKEIGCILCK